MASEQTEQKKKAKPSTRISSVGSDSVSAMANKRITMSRRKQLGQAVWLFCLFAHFVPENWSGNEPVVVAGGNVITDRDIAERLDVTCCTVADWRRRLRRAGLLTWLVSPGVGRVYFLQAINRLLGPEQKPFPVLRPQSHGSSSRPPLVEMPKATQLLN